ncbi:MAG: transketolase family protein, partial [Lachnoclostridium sp.]|nr:transketolase family protein [Lachnoclostridium sp.]
MIEERENIRDAFMDGLIDAAKYDERIVVLDADVSRTTKTRKFRDTYPMRFYDIGIAEQNMFGIASGLASTGLIPFATTFAVFTSMRAAEQIRTSICYPKLNVRMIGAYAGVSNGKDGATHQSVEDIAIMRSFPNCIVMAASDPVTAKKMALTSLEHEGPVYIRLEFEEVSKLHDEELDFKIGKGIVVKPGTQVSVMSYGIALERTMK